MFFQIKAYILFNDAIVVNGHHWGYIIVMYSSLNQSISYMMEVNELYILSDVAIVTNVHDRGYIIFMYSQVLSVYFPHHESFSSIVLTNWNIPFEFLGSACNKAFIIVQFFWQPKRASNPEGSASHKKYVSGFLC